MWEASVLTQEPVQKVSLGPGEATARGPSQCLQVSGKHAD